MKIICAWCGKVIRDGPEEPVSHGVCEECTIQVTKPEREDAERPRMMVAKCSLRG